MRAPRALRSPTPLLAFALLLTLVVPATAPPAAATFPGGNGPIAYVAPGSGSFQDVWLVNPDGTGVTNLTNHASHDTLPAISPDGGRVAFSSLRDGNDEIYVVNVDGSGLTRLTNDPALDRNPAWSPDGTQIVFVSTRAGGYDLFVMNADGSGQTPLPNTSGLDEFAPDWSPDGSRIAHSAGTMAGHSLYVTPAGGGPSTQVVATGGFDSNPSWSPDGSRIAFDSISTTTTDVWVINADGSNPVNLTASPSEAAHPSWSPDGTRIAFSTDQFAGHRDIATMAPDGSNILPVATSAQQETAPDWGPVALDPVTRLFGPERIATGVAVSANYVPAGTAGAVVLARADLFPDALAGTPLAVARGGPLLLTSSASLSSVTAAELQRVLPPGGTVYLLGSTAALSAQVEADVQALGYTTQRLGGSNRFATAVAIAQELGAPAPLYIADGGTFPAAEISGVAAAVNNGAVLLTSGTTLPPETANYLASRAGVPRFAVGNEAIAADPAATPVGGGDAYEVARNLATTAFGPTPPAVALASGTVFADGLTGGPHIAQFGAPLLLTDPTTLPASVRTYLLNHADPIGQLFVYGGPAAISDPVVADAQRAISGLP